MMLEIVTDLGTFGDFKDIEACMRLEGHNEVNIYDIKVMLTTFKGFIGKYTYSEIKQIVTAKDYSKV